MTTRKKQDPAPDHQWEQGWNEHEQMQLERLAKLSFAEKLSWLEDAHRLVIRLGTSNSTRAEAPDSYKY